MKKYIAIAAYSGKPSREHIAKARELIEELSVRCDKKDIVLLLGGYWGLMKYIVDYALEKGFKVVLFPPIEKEDYDYPEEAIVVKSGSSYRMRSIILVRTADVLIAAGGGAGTMHEIFTAYLEGRNIYVLTGMKLASDNLKRLGGYLDHRKLARLKYFNTPKELVEDVCREVLG